MPDRWMTIAEAAANLRVHPRTIERRIAGGKIETRRTDDGLLQVQINLPDMSDPGAPGPGTSIEAVRELAADQITLATGSASALVRFAQDVTVRSQQELDIVRHDVGRARRAALAAWCVVGLLAVGATIAVGWTASTITRARQDVNTLNERAEQTEREAQRLLTERDALRDKVQAAQIEAAQASARLAAYKEQSDNRPTTRPASLVQRIAAAIAEP